MRRRNVPLLVMTCDPRVLHHPPLYLHIIRRNKRSISAMKYKPMCMSFLSLVGVSSSLFFLSQRPTSANSSSAALSFWLSTLVLSAMYHVKSGHLDPRSLIPVTKQTIRRSHCSGQVPGLLMKLMDWAISQMCSLTLLSICFVVKPPISCQIPMVLAAHWLTPTLAFSAQTQTCRAGIWSVLASVTTVFGNQKASHYIIGSQPWSMIDWCMSNACPSEQASGVLTILSKVMRYGSRAEEGVLKGLEIISKVGRQGKYISGLGGFSWSGDIILAAIQLGNNILTTI